MDVMPKTLVRIPDLIVALKAVMPNELTYAIIIEKIASGDVSPHGYLFEVPLFDLSDIGNLAEHFREREVA